MQESARARRTLPQVMKMEQAAPFTIILLLIYMIEPSGVLGAIIQWFILFSFLELLFPDDVDENKK